jgi:hypothetical protein
MTETKLEEWHFDFGLCSQNTNLVSQSDCDELLDVIIDWAEQHGFCIGGGFRPFDESDE